MHPIAVHALCDIAEIAALGAFLVMIALIARAVGS
jgi:membrane protein implicated in regulation of membrane protease activity